MVWNAILTIVDSSDEIVVNLQPCVSNIISEKEAKAAKKKCKTAMEKGNMEGARIYAENAIREKNQALNCQYALPHLSLQSEFCLSSMLVCHTGTNSPTQSFYFPEVDLRLSSRIDAVAARVNTAVRMNAVTKSMGGIVKSMDSGNQSRWDVLRGIGQISHSLFEVDLICIIRREIQHCIHPSPAMKTMNPESISKVMDQVCWTLCNRQYFEPLYHNTMLNRLYVTVAVRAAVRGSGCHV